jgi:hypothetical protein
MEVVEQSICSLQEASQIFHTILSSFLYHLNGCIWSKKMGPPEVLMEEDDVTIYKWTLTMRECGLLISLNQLKLKVT